jgi:hypothetical protein
MTTPLEESRKSYRALHDRYCKLLDFHRRLQNKYSALQYWYETADRSAHSWTELDKIMENQDE